MFARIKRLLPDPGQLAGNRWLRWLGPRMFHPRLWHVSRRGVALGVAIGVFFGFLIPIAQIPVSAAVLGWLVLGHGLEARHFAGFGLIALGLIAIDGRVMRWGKR